MQLNNELAKKGDLHQWDHRGVYLEGPSMQPAKQTPHT